MNMNTYPSLCSTKTSTSVASKSLWDMNPYETLAVKSSELSNAFCGKIADPSKNKEIDRIKIPKENMIVIVRFYDGNEYKMVRREPDVFSLERACYLAIAKHEFGQFLTPSGIEAKATELSYRKEYEAIVKRGIAKYKRSLKEEEEAKEYAKRQKENRIAENERKRKKAAKRRERRIEEMKEAYLRAWNQATIGGIDIEEKDLKLDTIGANMCDDAK